MSSTRSPGAAPDLAALAKETYVYGYPLVYNLDEIAKLTSGAGVVRVPIAADPQRLTARALL